jgi:hypothetical protein
MSTVRGEDCMVIDNARVRLWVIDSYSLGHTETVLYDLLDLPDLLRDWESDYHDLMILHGLLSATIQSYLGLNSVVIVALLDHMLVMRTSSETLILTHLGS